MTYLGFDNNMLELEGRKPVLVAASCGPLIAATIFWIDTTLQLRTNILLYCCSAVLALGRLVNPVIAAMLADSVTERERAVCFPVLQVRFNLSLLAWCHVLPTL